MTSDQEKHHGLRINAKNNIAEVLVPLVTAPGVVLQEADLLVTAFYTMAVANVDFLDAFKSIKCPPERWSSGFF